VRFGGDMKRCCDDERCYRWNGVRVARRLPGAEVADWLEGGVRRAIRRWCCRPWEPGVFSCV